MILPLSTSLIGLGFFLKSALTYFGHWVCCLKSFRFLIASVSTKNVSHQASCYALILFRFKNNCSILCLSSNKSGTLIPNGSHLKGS